MDAPTLVEDAPAAGSDRALATTPACRARPRVLHLINGEHYAGAERVQDLLSARLPELGFDVELVCLKQGEFAWRRKHTAAACHALPMRGRADLGVLRRLIHLLRGGEFQLLHAHTPRAAMVGRLAALACGLPMVYHVHSPTRRDSDRPWANRINALVERLCIAGDVRLVAVSQSLRRQMVAEGVAAERIEVVPNGVPARPWVDRPSPGDALTLGMVALVRPRKGIETLLAALALARRGGRPLRLRVIGGFETSEYEAQVRRESEQLGLGGVIEWRGFCSDVDAELRGLDALVLPSLYGEGLPMVILEAMAAGVPVIASRVEGVPEVIADGREGLLCRPADPADLAAAIERLASGAADWQTLRANAWRLQAESFSDASMAAGVAAVYRKRLTRTRR